MANPNANLNLPPEHLWKKGQSGNPKGRPKKLLSKLKDKGYNKYEINWTIENLIAMTVDELKEVKKDKENTVLERIVATALLNSYKKGSLYAIDNLLTRAHGAPKQQIEQTNINKEFTVTFKKVEPLPIEPAPIADLLIEPPKEPENTEENTL